MGSLVCPSLNRLWGGSTSCACRTAHYLLGLLHSSRAIENPFGTLLLLLLLPFTNERTTFRLDFQIELFSSSTLNTVVCVLLLLRLLSSSSSSSSPNLSLSKCVAALVIQSPHENLGNFMALTIPKKSLVSPETNKNGPEKLNDVGGRRRS